MFTEVAEQTNRANQSDRLQARLNLSTLRANVPGVVVAALVQNTPQHSRERLRNRPCEIPYQPIGKQERARQTHGELRLLRILIKGIPPALVCPPVYPSHWLTFHASCVPARNLVPKTNQKKSKRTSERERRHRSRASPTPE